MRSFISLEFASNSMLIQLDGVLRDSLRLSDREPYEAKIIIFDLFSSITTL